MRILFFLINMNLGGTEKSFLNLIKELPKDVEVDLLLLENKGQLMEEVPSNVNIKIIDNSPTISKYISSGARLFGFQKLKEGNILLFLMCMIQFLLDKIDVGFNPYWAINNYIKPLDKEYDVSIAYAGIHNFIAHFIVNNTTSRKKMLWIHFDVSNVLTDTKFGNRFYDEFDRLLCVSENAKHEFVKMFPKLERKTDVFENIVSDKFIKEQAEVGDTFNDDFTGIRIVTLGRLSKEKGQDMIPKVVKRLKDQNYNFRWYMIGDGKLSSKIENQIIEYSLQKHIVLLGSLVNPYGFLKNCDIYVQTSLHEGYCITLHEAKVFNKPIITTDFLSADNLIADNVDGLIVEISEDGLYNGIKKVLDNAVLLEYLQTNKKVNNNVSAVSKIKKLFS